MFTCFGDWLAARREALGFETQASFRSALERAGLSVSRTTVSKWESSERNHSPAKEHRPIVWHVLGVHGEHRREIEMAIDGHVGFPAVVAA